MHLYVFLEFFSRYICLSDEDNIVIDNSSTISIDTSFAEGYLSCELVCACVVHSCESLTDGNGCPLQHL